MITIIYVALIAVDVVAVTIYTFVLCDMIKDYKRRKRMAKKSFKFSKLYYTTLAGERKLNGASLYIPKDAIEVSGINVDAPVKISVVDNKIIIEEDKENA